jgi:hypothetical protein
VSAPAPARYYPFVLDGGRYQVKAGLYALGTDFGNGAADRVVFQRDTEYETYLAAKAAAAATADAGALAVVVDDGCGPAVLRAVRDYVADQVVAAGWATGAALAERSLHAIALGLQEDLAIAELGDGAAPETTRLTYLDVALPSGWVPWSKRGRTFAEVHKPIPGIERVPGDTLMAGIIRGGETGVRFVWGLQFDHRVDQHPKRGRTTTFDRGRGLWLRVERQIVVGMPDVRAMLFVIRPYVVPMAEVLADPERARALTSAIESMNERELRYKGLQHVRDDVLAYLAATAPGASGPRSADP